MTTATLLGAGRASRGGAPFNPKKVRVLHFVRFPLGDFSYSRATWGRRRPPIATGRRRFICPRCGAENDIPEKDEGCRPTRRSKPHHYRTPRVRDVLRLIDTVIGAMCPS